MVRILVWSRVRTLVLRLITTDCFCFRNNYGGDILWGMSPPFDLSVVTDESFYLLNQLDVLVAGAAACDDDRSGTDSDDQQTTNGHHQGSLSTG